MLSSLRKNKLFQLKRHSIVYSAAVTNHIKRLWGGTAGLLFGLLYLFGIDFAQIQVHARLRRGGRHLQHARGVAHRLISRVGHAGVLHVSLSPKVELVRAAKRRVHAAVMGLAREGWSQRPFEVARCGIEPRLRSVRVVEKRRARPCRFVAPHPHLLVMMAVAQGG